MPILDPRLTAASDKIEDLEARLAAKDKEIERLQDLLDELDTEEMPDGKGHIKAKKALDGIDV
jgi:uncharacterized coiled-coil protein SlyX